MQGMSARWSLVVAAGLGIALMAVPLYLWRRPRLVHAAAGAEGATGPATPFADGGGLGGPNVASSPAPPPSVTVAEVHVVSCP